MGTVNVILTTLGIVLLFTLVGGFFAASETALVSLRESQVHRLAETEPRRGAKLRELTKNPNRFLASVQVGVTLAGFISAGFGASNVVPVIAPWLTARFGLSEGLASTLALVSSTIVVAFVSLVVGELFPKRLALQKAEGVALAVAGPIDLIGRMFRPFIWLLSVSTNVLVRLFGLDPRSGRESITGEELRGIVASHEELTDQERELIDDVFEAGDRQLREVMIPRTEVDFLSADTPVFRAAVIVSQLPHSRYPIMGVSPDDVIGFVHVRDILAPHVVDRSIRLGDLAREVAFFPGSKPVIPALAEMRKGGHHLAVVADEYGGTAGIVTMEDLVEELVGDIHDEYDTDFFERPARRGGRFEIDGLLNLEDFAEEAGFELPDGPYETVAGWFVSQLGHLPHVGEHVDLGGARFEVLQLDGRRIARLAVTGAPTTWHHREGAGESPGEPDLRE